MTKLIKCIVPVFALALVMTVPGFGVGGDGMRRQPTDNRST